MLYRTAVIALYRRCRYIEETVPFTKRLLGLSYLRAEVADGSALQIWAAW